MLPPSVLTIIRDIRSFPSWHIWQPCHPCLFTFCLYLVYILYQWYLYKVSQLWELYVSLRHGVSWSWASLPTGLFILFTSSEIHFTALPFVLFFGTSTSENISYVLHRYSLIEGEHRDRSRRRQNARQNFTESKKVHSCLWSYFRRNYIDGEVHFKHLLQNSEHFL